MSWENVAGISKFQIWAEPSSSSEGDETFLFVNGNHQVQITVGLSLALWDTAATGPTLEEVKSALTLVNNNDGGSLNHLVTGSKGNYVSIYDPSHVNATQVAETDFQYEVNYYLSSNTTINANIVSEEVSVKIAYTNSDGTFITDMSQQGEYSVKDYVKVTCYAEKKYGLSGSNKTEIILSEDDNSPEHSFHQSSDYKTDDSSLWLYRLVISDSYFKIVDINYGENQKIYGNIQTLAYGYDQSSAAMWMYTASVFCPTLLYGVGQKNISDTYQYSVGSVDTIYVQYECVQHNNEIILLAAEIDIKRSDSITGHSSSKGGLNFHDQFGNEIKVTFNYDYVDDHKLIPHLDAIN
ncbi:TPA: hypothetical protein N2F43_002957 [Salmonella enterica]|nr:hypothetical protein [Salmonella enterica]